MDQMIKHRFLPGIQPSSRRELVVQPVRSEGSQEHAKKAKTGPDLRPLHPATVERIPRIRNPEW